MRVLQVFLALVLVGACATPGVYPRGPAIQAPAYEANAFVMADGVRLPARVWEAADASGKPVKARAVVIGLHGMNDYSNAFDAPARDFARHGIATYAFDQRCFGGAPHRGKWPGTKSMVADLADVTALVRARHPDTPVYLVGLSMGAAVILAAAGRNELPPADGVVLIAPAVWGWDQMNILYRITLWLGAHLMPDKTLTGERLKVWPSDNIEMLRKLSRDPMMIGPTKIGAIYGLVTLMDDGFDGAHKLNDPALVLYGKKDQIVPAASVHKMAREIPGPKRFVIYTWGYHMLERDLQAQNVYRDIEAWLNDRQAPLPTLALPQSMASEIELAPSVVTEKPSR